MEFERQGVVTDGAEDGHLSKWVPMSINRDYAMCSSYPRTLYMPRCLDSGSIKASAAYRSKGRLPVLAWYNKRKGNAIVRCAQPKAGLRSRRSDGDEVVIEACLKASNNADQIIIFDARSQVAAGGNKLMGKGTEAAAAYHNAKIVFMEIANIHAVRASYDALRELISFGNEVKWLSSLEATGWLRHIRSVLSGAIVVARKMERMAVTCVVHCSDGWDRTAELTSLAQFMLDPHYRTLDGFIILVEKEWLSFGHKFHDRQLSAEHPHERSPIFCQFLDCVWQIINQLPTAVEFNQQLLIRLADHSQSGWFGTFLFNTERQRRKFRLDNTSTSLWSHIRACRAELMNPTYDASKHTGLITPISSMKKLALWTDYYLRFDGMLNGGCHVASSQPPPAAGATTDILGKLAFRRGPNAAAAEEKCLNHYISCDWPVVISYSPVTPHRIHTLPTHASTLSALPCNPYRCVRPGAIFHSMHSLCTVTLTHAHLLDTSWYTQLHTEPHSPSTTTLCRTG